MINAQANDRVSFDEYFKNKYPELYKDVSKEDGDDRAIIGYTFGLSAWVASRNEARKAMLWLVTCDTGLSSECLMATMLNGGPLDRKGWKTYFHPHDPADLKRCVSLLDMVPEFRERLELMKSVSPQWAILVAHWDELESSLKEEIEANTGKAPKTYDLMKNLLKQAEGNNE